MKGISMIRVHFRPHAYCLGDESDDPCAFDRTGDAPTVRADAQRHVKATGHDVYVDITDRTHYGPEAS